MSGGSAVYVFAYSIFYFMTKVRYILFHSILCDIMVHSFLFLSHIVSIFTLKED